MSSSSSSSSSTSAFVSSLIFYGILGSIFAIAFTVLRPKQPRVYEPKRFETADNPESEKQPPEVPRGPTSWITFLLSKPQSYYLQFIGLDGYLFTRYVGIFAGISLLGCFMLLPILLPVNATNGQNLEGFELLSFANVTNNKRYYAHVFLSWFFFGLVVFVIYKELVFYVSLRHATQTTPLYDGLLSSRTVLITELPDQYMEETELKSVFPLAVRTWYARDYKELEKLVKERTKLANKYEGTLNKVISKGVKLQKKMIKKNQTLPEDPNAYIKKQPTHKLGKIPFIGKKVNTIDYSIERLGELNTEIGESQQNYETAKKLSSVFIEFPNQLEAQRAYQAIPFTDFRNRYIGVAPDDIVWENLGMSRTQRTIKRIIGNTVLTLMIIFWAIPVAVVGCISNITFLTEKVPFLKFINNCPSVLLGLITGILPTVALSILMSLVPVFIKAVGKKSGLITKQQVELYCQSWYFGFQVIQVFIVVTLASSASSTVTAIIDDPSSAMTLLAQNLPKASNFYISYFLLQGVYAPAWSILQAVPLLLANILSFLQNTPRKKWNKLNTLKKPAWGVVYPPVELLVVLFLVYAIIAPVILIFSTFALAAGYLVYLYMMTYVNGNDFDLRGRNYPKALFQTFVGLYLAEICCLGLFIMAKTWGPVALEGFMLLVTVLAHLYYKRQFEPLFDIVPISGIKEARGDASYEYPKDQGFKEIKQVGKNYNGEADQDEVSPLKDNNVANDSNSSRNDTVIGQEPTKEASTSKSAAELEQDKVNKETNIGNVESQAKQKPLQVVKRFLNPKDGYNFSLLRSQLPPIFNLSTSYQSEFLNMAYMDPAIQDEEPHIWIPKDPMGISEMEIAKTEGKVDVSDVNTSFTEKGKFDISGPPPAYEDVVKL